MVYADRDDPEAATGAPQDPCEANSSPSHYVALGVGGVLAVRLDIDHAGEKSCACTTCHVIVREGFDSLNASSEEEDDLLDKAWGLEPESRLSCQAIVADEDLTIEIPRYTINMVSEHH